MIHYCHRLFVAVILVVLAQHAMAADATGPLLQNGNARVVLVGDSITGQSRNMANIGFAYQLEAALKAIYPECKPNIIALGGSGQGIGSWTGVEKNSRTQSAKLDVPGIDVKETLDQHADVLVIMLGMNDVLAPYVGEDQASLDRWQSQYEKLIEALQQRLTPRVIGLAKITPATEEMHSPKNQLIAALNERVEVIAKKIDARVLPAGDTVREILQHGRTLRSNFHVTNDFVHPNEAGHIGIAIGMLEGLGEIKAAQWLRDERLSKIWKTALGEKPAMAWSVTPVNGAIIAENQAFRVHFWWPQNNPSTGSKPRVELVAPKGWQVSPQSVEGFDGEFTATGSPDQIKNIFILQGAAGDEQRRVEVMIPAPWLITAKLVQPVWDGIQFQSDKGRTPIDPAIEASREFTGAIDVGRGQMLTWQRYFSSVNFTGLDDPASVDFFAISPGQNFEGGYGARWIRSDKARDVKLKLDSKIFAGNMHLVVWLNGEEIYKGMITAESPRPKVVNAKLRSGSNTLVFKANHRAWQWHVTVGLAPLEGDSLDDLRYATTPPANP